MVRSGAGLSPAAVVDAALAVLDAGGLESLTLAAVAERAGVAPPSLYKHISGLADLRALVAVRVMDELVSELTGAVVGRSRDDAIEALMWAGRRYIQRYPARYVAVPPDPLRDPATAEAGARLIEVFLAVLRGYRLSGPAAIHATRVLRSMLHGFCAIEAAGGFGLPEDLDETFRQLIHMFTQSLGRKS
jgi:AcrR family transcriptional regulator